MKFKNWQINKFQSPTGATLALRHLPSTKKAKAIILINHGMAEHSGRYERLAKALSNAGYHVFAHDHRGHGETTAKDAPLGIFGSTNGLKKVQQDIEAVRSFATESYPSLPIILLGHSMGSILSLHYLIDHSDRLQAVMLLNSGVDGGPLLFVFRALLKIAKAFKGSDVPAILASKLTFDDWNNKFKPNRTAFDWLSQDNVEVDKYIADPKCGFAVSNGLWLDITDAIKRASKDAELIKIQKHLQILLVAGDKDPCSDYGKAVDRVAERLENVGIKNVTNLLLKDTRHESLNEINRDQTTQKIINWLDGLDSS